MKTPEVSRRRFVQGALACGTALGLAPRLAFAESDSPTGDTLVLVVLRGGLDGLSALPPLGEEGAYHDPRRGIDVPEKRALPVDGRFGLHPALAPLHELYQDGVVAFVPAVGSSQPSRSHFDQQAMLERGKVGSPHETPGWLGRHLASRAAGPLQAVAGSPQLPMVLHGARSATAIPSLDQLSQQLEGVGDLDRGGEHLRRLCGNGPIGAAAATSTAAAIALAGLPAGGDLVGDYPRGQVAGLRDIARLLHGGVAVDAAVIDVGGWDLHAGMGDVNSGNMQTALTDLGRGLAAFHADVAGLARPVTTVVVSEFGRTVAMNGTGGTDHGRGGLAMAIGEGIDGGVFGPWPGLSPDALDDGALPVATDFRDVLAEIVSVRLGNPDLATVFPGHDPVPVGITRT